MRARKNWSAAFICGCCAERMHSAKAGGLYFAPNGTLVEYLLCCACAVRREHDPQAVMAAIEQRYARSLTGPDSYV